MGDFKRCERPDYATFRCEIPREEKARVFMLPES